jgi:hypothetical protein
VIFVHGSRRKVGIAGFSQNIAVQNKTFFASSTPLTLAGYAVTAVLGTIGVSAGTSPSVTLSAYAQTMSLGTITPTIVTPTVILTGYVALSNLGTLGVMIQNSWTPVTSDSVITIWTPV